MVTVSIYIPNMYQSSIFSISLLVFLKICIHPSRQYLIVVILFMPHKGATTEMYYQPSL